MPNGLETEIVERSSYSDSIELYGIALRNEIPLYADGNIGSVSYNVEDGERVAINSTVASYVSDSSSDENYVKLSKINRKISMLESSLSKSAISDTAALEDSVRDKITIYLNSLDTGSFNKSDAEDIQISLNKKSVKLDGATPYSEALDKLKSEKQELLSSIGNEEKVKATQAGYFLSSFDGYESIKADEHNKMTVEDFNSIMSMSPPSCPENYIGKLHNNTVWYYSADVTEETAKNYKVGESVTLVFNLATTVNDEVKTTVYNISQPASGKCIITFKCTDFTEKEFSLRKEKCKMLINKYEGLKVSNEALRVSNGQTGVYVMLAKNIVFKPVSVLFSTDTFSIVKPDNAVSSRILTHNDEVVLGGKDLFDGKVVGVG